MPVLAPINWKRIRRVFLWSTMAVLAANLARLIYTGSEPAKALAAAPHVAYTVLRTETGFDQAGTPKYTNHYVEAVRSDGSRMWRGSTSDVQQRKMYFANGDEVRTNELLSRKSTYPKVHAGDLLQRNPQTSCFTAQDQSAGWALGGEDTIEGYRAVRLLHKTNHRTMTAWYALDAGCALLRQRFEHETGVTEQNLAALIFGEPDAALFQVSASFQEVTPSRLFDVCSDAVGGCKSALPEAVKQRLDKRYVEARAQTP